jgi:hypothetical protein
MFYSHTSRVKGGLLMLIHVNRNNCHEMHWSSSLKFILNRGEYSGLKGYYNTNEFWFRKICAFTFKFKSKFYQSLSNSSYENCKKWWYVFFLSCLLVFFLFSFLLLIFKCDLSKITKNIVSSRSGVILCQNYGKQNNCFLCQSIMSMLLLL